MRWVIWGWFEYAEYKRRRLQRRIRIGADAGSVPCVMSGKWVTESGRAGAGMPRRYCILRFSVRAGDRDAVRSGRDRGCMSSGRGVCVVQTCDMRKTAESESESESKSSDTMRRIELLIS